MANAGKWADKVARRLFIGGNWKCNGSITSIQSLIKDTVNQIKFDTSKLQVLVSPVALHLPAAKGLLNPKVILSAQNVSQFKNGAYTGEVSAQQLKDFGIDWTLIGHSERRTYFAETNEVRFHSHLDCFYQGKNGIGTWTEHCFLHRRKTQPKRSRKDLRSLHLTN
jgi:triosephosphate isomerase